MSGAPEVRARIRSASRRHSPVHASSAGPATSRTRSASRSARSIAPSRSASVPAESSSRARVPALLRPAASRSTASGPGAPASSRTTAIVRGGGAEAIGVRLAASWAPSARVSPTAKPGSWRTSASNCARDTSSSTESRRALTDAVRRPACRRASSPTTSPRRSVRTRVSGGPSTRTSSRPERITYITSASSPSRRSQSPAATVTLVPSAASRSLFSRERPVNTRHPAQQAALGTGRVWRHAGYLRSVMRARCQP